VKKDVLIKSPNGKRQSHYVALRLDLSGVDFRANHLIFNSSSMVTLRIDWLTTHDAMTQCANRIVLMRTEPREMMEVKGISSEESR
jgi:hypothetical protein